MVAYGRTRNPGKVDTLALSSTYVNAVLADGPAGFWMLDDTTGTVATDISGNGRHGTYVAGYTLDQPGTGGTARAVSLTGEASGTGRVTFPNAAATSLTGDFTMGIVLKMSGLAVGAWNLLSLVAPSEWSQPLQIGLGSASGAVNKFTLKAGNTGSSETDIFSETGSDLGTGWHHVAFRASGSSPTTWKIYVDGTEAASTTSSQARANSGEVLSLGRRTNSSAQRGRTGLYAGLYLCPSALSNARIAAHAAAGLA